MDNYNFLSDLPLSGKDFLSRERFGHSGIGESLKAMVKRCPTPFTIGLFGKWGTGKSSISNFLRDRLKGENVNVVIFDVWKYEDDSLRREFLKSVEKEFKKEDILDKKYDVEADMYKKVSVSFPEEPRFSWNRLKLLIPYLIGSYFVTLLVLYLLQRARDVVDVPKILIESLIIPILMGVLHNFRDVVVTDQRTEEYHSLDSPELFEKKFEELLAKTKKRTLIIIDNLDRCSHEKAVELLSTLKSFLEKPNCIFLIPCDNEAIKKHIEKVYSNDGSSSNSSLYSDEFLRKFFNAYLLIPEFIDKDLEEYTQSLLDETDVKEFSNNTEVAAIITTAFRDNPRQIKQFINVLLTQFIFIKEREKGENPLIKPPISDNVGLISKLLVIQQRFSKEYSMIKNGDISVSGVPKEGSDEFKAFMNGTRATPAKKVNNLRPYFYLKQSEFELRIPDAENLEIALEDSRTDIVEEKFKSAKKSKEGLKDSGEFVLTILKDNKTKKERLLYIITSFLQACSNLTIKFDNKNLYNFVAGVLGDELKEKLHFVSPQLVFNEVLSMCDAHFRDNIIQQYMDIILAQSGKENPYEVNEGWEIELFKSIFDNLDIFKAKESQIKKSIEDTYSSEFAVLSLLNGRKDLQKRFLSSEAVNKFISTFTKDDVENDKPLIEKVNLLIDFEEIITVKDVDSLLQKLHELIKHEYQIASYRNQKKTLFDSIERLLAKFNDKLSDVEKSSIDKLAEVTVNSFNNIGNWSDRKIFVLPMVLLVPYATSSKSNLITYTNQFWQNAKVGDLEYVFLAAGGEYSERIIKDYYLLLQDRALQSSELFERVYQYAGMEEKKKLFRAILDSPQYPWVFNMVNKGSQKLKLDKKFVVEKLLNRVGNITPPTNKREFYGIINNFKCGNDIGFRDTYVNQIVSLIKNNDSSSQEVGFEAFSNAGYLSQQDKVLVSREAKDWLKQKTILAHTEIFALKTAILYYNLLTTQEVDDLIYILIDKILVSNQDLKLLKEAAGLLKIINPAYDRNSDTVKYYEALFHRAERESNPDIKSLLISLLGDIKELEKQKEFMNKVKGLQKKLG